MEATTLDPYFSDHTPLAIEVRGRGLKGDSLFRFFIHLVHHPGFISLMNNKWNCGQYMRGMEAVWYKLKQVKLALKTLNYREFSKVAEKVEYYRNELAEIQHETRNLQK